MTREELIEKMCVKYWGSFNGHTSFYWKENMEEWERDNFRNAMDAALRVAEKELSND